MFQRCEKVISETGLEGFLDIYGVLPLVQPEECDSPTKTPGTTTTTTTSSTIRSGTHNNNNNKQYYKVRYNNNTKRASTVTKLGMSATWDHVPTTTLQGHVHTVTIVQN